MRHKRDHPEYKYQPRRRRLAGGSSGVSEGIPESCNGQIISSSSYNARSPQNYKVYIASISALLIKKILTKLTYVGLFYNTFIGVGDLMKKQHIDYRLSIQLEAKKMKFCVKSITVKWKMRKGIINNDNKYAWTTFSPSKPL